MRADYNDLTLAVEGYPTRYSYRPGETVEFHCSARVPRFSVESARQLQPQANVYYDAKLWRHAAEFVNQPGVPLWADRARRSPLAQGARCHIPAQR